MVTVDEFKRESVRDVTVIVNASLIDSCECGWCALIVCVYLFFFWGGKSLNAFVVGRLEAVVSLKKKKTMMLVSLVLPLLNSYSYIRYLFHFIN